MNGMLRSLLCANYTTSIESFREASAVFQDALLSDENNDNYTNLLIDQKKYHEAHSILSELVSAYPDYNDAKVNLERVNFYIASGIQESNSEANSPDDGNFLYWTIL